MLDPLKSHSLDTFSGCEEYSHTCPMEDRVSTVLYNDLKFTRLTSGSLSSEQVKNGSIWLQKRISIHLPSSNLSTRQDNSKAQREPSLQISNQQNFLRTQRNTHPQSSVMGKLLDSSTGATSEATTVAKVSQERPHNLCLWVYSQRNSFWGENNDFVDLEEIFSQIDSGIDGRDSSKECLSLDTEELRRTKSQVIISATEKQVRSAPNFLGTERDAEDCSRLGTCQKQEQCQRWTSSPTPRELGTKKNKDL